MSRDQAKALIICCLISASILVSSANAATDWAWANPTPQGNYLNASASGNTVSVAVGSAGTVYSNAGGGWAEQASGTGKDLSDVTYGAGLFVAVGPAGTIITSNDGVHWTTASVSSNTQELHAIAYGNGTFVAVGTHGIVFTSNDGVNWVLTGNISDALTVTDIAFGGGTFVAVAHDRTTSAPAMLESSDGVTWNPANIATAPTDPYEYVTYNGSLFVAVGANATGTGGSIMTSSDGINWSLHSPLAPSTYRPISITADGSDFAILLKSESSDSAVTASMVIMKSSDGTNWSAVASNNLPASWSQSIPRQVSYTGSAYLVVGAGAYIATSSDLVNWSEVSPVTRLTYERLRGTHWLGSRFFSVGDNDTVLTSDDGITWGQQTLDISTPSNLRDIAYNGQRYVIVGSNGVVLTSADGSNWTATRISPAVDSATVFEGIAWNGSLFVIVGSGGAIYTSADGLIWVAQYSGTTDNLWGVAWNGNYFVAVSDALTSGKPILISDDGIDWQTPAFNPDTPISLYGIHWDGARMITAGSAVNESGYTVGFMATSLDCFCWTSYYSNVQDTFSDAIFNGDTFVAVGQSTVYTSSDGTTWSTPAPGIQNVKLQDLVLHNGQLLASGYAGVILHATSIAPTAEDGAMSTEENTPVKGTLKAFGDNLTFTVSQPAHGTVVLDDAKTGAVTYTPASGYSGTDSFTFSASNSAGASNTATESISISAAPSTEGSGSSSSSSGSSSSGSSSGTGSSSGGSTSSGSGSGGGGTLSLLVLCALSLFRLSRPPKR